jgi:L-iditol 2-dehydrogenase
MHCAYCKNGHYPQCSEVKERLPGGFAEFILVPEILVKNGTYLLPENITYDQSTFIEPLACVVRAQRLAGLKECQVIVVLGCGISGLLHVKLARARGCTVIATDINQKRLSFAKQIGAAITIDAADDVPQRVIAENGRKAAVVMLCTSAVAAIEQAWQCMDKGGAIVFFAVPEPEKQVVAPVNQFWTQEVRILTSYYCGPPDITEALELIESGTVQVDDLVTHRFPLNDITEAFQLVMDGKEAIKVLIKPNVR